MSNTCPVLAAVASWRTFHLIRVAFERLRKPFRRQMPISTFFDLNDHHLDDIGLTRADILEGELNHRHRRSPF